MKIWCCSEIQAVASTTTSITLSFGEGGWTVNPVGNTGFVVVDWSELESCTVQYSTTKRKDLLQAISKPGPGYFYIFCYKDISTKRGKDIFLIMRSG